MNFLNSIVKIVIYSNAILWAASAFSYDFPTFNERRTGVPIEVVAEGYGRLGTFDVLRTLGQECIDANNIIPRKEMNIIIIASSPLGTGVSVTSQGVDRFGKKYIQKIYTCNYDKELRRIISIEK